MSIAPKSLSANGLYPMFGYRKKWYITCGGCEHTWRERVPVHEPSSAICPCCGEQNIWSMYKFGDAYEEME